MGTQFAFASKALLVACFMSLPLPAQTLPTTSFPSQALQAFSPGSVLLHGVTITGTVHRIAGSTDERGTVDFQASDKGLEHEGWTLSSGNRTEDRTAFTDGRSCSVAVGGKTTGRNDANCKRAVPWFAPSISLWMVPAVNSSVEDATTQADRTAGLVRLRFTPPAEPAFDRTQSVMQMFAALNAAAAVDVLFSETTYLPQRTEYRQTVNSDPSADIQVAVSYSDYRLDGGLMIPHHVQRYVQRSLESDIQITNLSVR